MDLPPIIVPEVILLDAYKKALSFIRSNYRANKTDPTKSYLGIILGGTALQRYGMLEQAKAVFITTENDPRNIDVNIFYNMQRQGIPTLHITNPSDSPIHDSVSIGQEINPTIFDDTLHTFTPVFNRRFKTRYSIIVTSDNTNEVLMIYHVIRSITISMIEHLQLSGLENMRLSGNEISLNAQFANNLYMKGVNLEFEYNVPAIKLTTDQFFLGPVTPVGTVIGDTTGPVGLS